MTLWKPRACPRCGGDCYQEEEGRDILATCLQCGRSTKVGSIPHQERPMLEPHEVRYNTMQTLFYEQRLRADTIAAVLDVSKRTVWRGIKLGTAV